MTQRLSCTECGASIHPDTAAQNGGLCLPCKRGYTRIAERIRLKLERQRASLGTPPPYYFKRRWDPPEEDADDHPWGGVVWLAEVDENFWPMRRIVIRDDGQVLFYDRQHDEDEHGSLGPLLDPDELADARATREEFEDLWSTRKPLNRA